MATKFLFVIEDSGGHVMNKCYRHHGMVYHVEFKYAKIH